MNEQLMTTTATLPPSVIGFNTRDGRVIGLREAASIPFATLAKATWAAAIGRSVVKTRQIMGEQAADKALAVTLKRQRDDLMQEVTVLRAELADRPMLPPAVLIEAPAKAKRPRWSAAERKTLGELLAVKKDRNLTYALIAKEMETLFDRKFTAETVGYQARRLKATEPVKATSATVGKRKARKAAGKSLRRRAK